MGKVSKQNYNNVLELLNITTRSSKIPELFSATMVVNALRKRHKGISLDSVRRVLAELEKTNKIKLVRTTVTGAKLFKRVSAESKTKEIPNDTIGADLYKFLQEFASGLANSQDADSITDEFAEDVEYGVTDEMVQEQLDRFVAEKKLFKTETVDGNEYYVPLASHTDDEVIEQDTVLDDELDELDESPVEEKPEERTVEFKWLNLPVEMKQDYSVSNPKLHALYVGWAMDNLQLLNQAIESFNNQSAWPAGQIATDLMMRRREYILTQAEYRDAAAYLVAGITPYEWKKAHGNDTDGSVVDLPE